MNEASGAQVFREAWIAGVRRHYPGEPKASYVTPWEDMAGWERTAAGAVYGQVYAFLALTDGAAGKLSRDQKGRFVALCWIGQVLRHFPDPKPGYVADWDTLPDLQQRTDADIFERVEADYLAGVVR